MRLSYSATVIRDLQASCDLFARVLADESFVSTLANAAELIVEALAKGRKILFAGNGGSAADAQHLAAELVVRFKIRRRALPAIALSTDTSILTAVGNDFGFDYLFSRQIEALGQPGDVFVGISTSGRSPNILAACRAAQSQDMIVIGFGAGDGGDMQSCCNLLIRVPSDDTPLIQQVHIAAGHIVCAIAESSLASSDGIASKE